MSNLQKAWFNEKTNEIMTPKIRLVYPTLLEPKINQKFPTNPPKFSATALVPKACDISVIVQAVQKICVDLWGDKWKEADPAVKLPIKKTAANEKLADFAEEFPFFLRTSANADYPPILFGPDAKPLAKRDGSEVYGGRWAILALNPWGPKPEKKNINRFVSLGVQRVQFLDHDERIATGRNETAEGFEAADVGGGAGDDSSDALFD